MHAALNSPGLVVSLAMLVGVLAQVVARHVDVPGIVLLLIAGVALGPDVANLIRPSALGVGLEALVGFAVAVILFDGGLHLNLKLLRTQQVPIRRLVLMGSVLTAVGGALFAHWLLAWDWRHSFLFGTLVIVTGPTVITPLLRRIHARRSVETILEAEGIFIDAVGATIAVVALEVLLAPPNDRWSTAIAGIATRLGVGTGIGLLGGALFAVCMRFRKTLPEGLANVAALASAVAIFEASNALVAESGITAAIFAGMVVGNTRSHDIAELRAFKEQLTLLLVATLFVLLAADVRLSNIVALGWPGLLVVLGLIFVVRPVDVFASTLGTSLEFREKAFLSWLAPRGIVAAAVSSLFAARLSRAGIEGGEAIRALVFLVIAVTVVIQGMTAGGVASLLGVRAPREVGYVILGADEVSRLLGAALARSGEEVVFIDTSQDFARAAEEAGFKVVFGDGLDERALLKARVETRRACIGATPNESVNLLFASKVHAFAKHVTTYVAIERKAEGVSAAMVKQQRAHVLFVCAQELAKWRTPILKQGVEVQSWQLAEGNPSDAPHFEDLASTSALPFTLTRDGLTTPAERPFRARAGDVLRLAIALDQVERMEAELTAQGWTKLADAADGSVDEEQAKSARTDAGGLRS